MTLKRRITNAARDYRRNPSNARLRALLDLKARAGIWDDRFCAYYGVDHRVNRGTKKFIMRGWRRGLVPTSTTGGKHAPGSYHPRQMAADLGLRKDEVGTARGQRKMRRFQRAEYRRFRAGRAKYMLELIGPVNNRIVLRGRVTSLAEGTALENQHDNHVHGAFTK